MVTYGHILVRQEAELAQNVLIPDTIGYLGFMKIDKLIDVTFLTCVT